jgi:4-hydroxybenzoate polyprenyltransferase
MSQDHRHAVDFLIAEYKHFADSFWRSEETGEKRINFFITLVTAVISALVALSTAKESLGAENVFSITVFALAALLAFGVVTLLRMIKRNRSTDDYKDAMDAIRDQFRKLDPDALKDYNPFDEARARQRKARKLGSGSLAEITAVFNSLVAAAVSAIIAQHEKWIVWLPAALVFAVMLAAQLAFIKERQAQGRAQGAQR